MHIQINRRDFLKGAALVSTLGLAPQFLARTAEAQAAAGSIPKDERILVVVQLGGGNDGLNTVVPWSNDSYYRLRPTIGIKKDRLIRLTDDFAVNDKLAKLKGLYDDGKVALIQGVGYPNPDRSHFRSMEIWHTASSSDEYLGSGWLGRYFDNYCTGADRPQVGAALGKERPQAFTGDKGFGISCEHPLQFGWELGKGADTERNFSAINSGPASKGSTLDFLRHTTSNAIMSSNEVKEAARSGGIERGMEKSPMAMVAGLIRGGLSTRIYYISASGFDTHANQVGQHENLLERFATGMAEFQQTLKKDANEGRVLTMVFSEFGRRVEQNASNGTDHGTAAPMFLVGSGVRAGIHGAMPSLDDLDNGDLKHHTDFRSVYATVLEKWLKIDPSPVLQHPFPTMDIIA